MFVHYNESCLLLVLQQLFSGIHTVSCFLQAWNCLSLSSSFDICLNISATEVICCLSYNSCFLGPSIWCSLLDTIEPGWGLKFQLLHRGDILKWSYYWQYPLSSKLPSFSNTFMLVSTIRVSIAWVAKKIIFLVTQHGAACQTQLSQGQDNNWHFSN